MYSRAPLIGILETILMPKVTGKISITKMLVPLNHSYLKFALVTLKYRLILDRIASCGQGSHLQFILEKLKMIDFKTNFKENANKGKENLRFGLFPIKVQIQDILATVAVFCCCFLQCLPKKRNPAHSIAL